MNRRDKDNQLNKKRITINPFSLYALIWTIVLLLYSFKFSSAMPNLTAPVIIFLVGTIIISMFLGIKFSKRTLVVHKRFKDINVFIPMLIIVTFFIIEMIVSKSVPLFDSLKSGNVYGEFQTIPFLHVFVVTFSTFFSGVLALLFFANKKSKYLLSYVIVVFIFLLLNYRSGISFSVFMAGLIYLFRKKLSIKVIIIGIVLVIVGLYLFGVLGNIRSGCNWNDSSLIVEMVGLNDNYPSFIPKEFLWSYIYLTSPLANLQQTINLHTPSYSIFNFLLINVWDFVSKRIAIIDLPHEFANPIFNVTSAFTEQYLTLGYVGVALYFLLLCFICFMFFKFMKNSTLFPVALSVLSIITTFSFFVNMVSYSTVSFMLVYCVIFCKVLKPVNMLGGLGLNAQKRKVGKGEICNKN